MIDVTKYTGVPYEQGKDDCYSLMQKIFLGETGVTLPDFVAPRAWWLTPGLNLIQDNFMSAGFEALQNPVQDLKIGDCFLIAIGCSVPSHCAMYVGQNNILHHPYGKLSVSEFYRGGWRRLTVQTVRHKTAVFEQPTYAVANMIDLLLPSKRALFVSGTADQA